MTLLVAEKEGDRVTRAWDGKAVVCIASGPSLTAEQIEQVRQARERDTVRVIVVNDNYLIAPFADVLYYADEKWKRWHQGGIARSWPWAKFNADQVRAAFAAFGGQKCTLKLGADSSPGVFHLKRLLSDGLSTDPAGLATGNHSGHQALNIAVLSGGRPIILLGYDGQRANGAKHAFGEHPDGTEPPYAEIRAAARTTGAVLERLGVQVVNGSPGSAFHFPKARLEAVLP